MTTLRDRILDRMAALDINAYEVVRRMSGRKVHRAYIKDLLDGRKSTIAANRMEDVAVALETTVAFLTGNDENVKSTEIGAAVKPLRIPILGTARGAITENFSIQEKPINYVPSPPALVNATGIYALLVEGNSMAPRYRPGDLIFLDPHRKHRPGDDVIVRLQNHRGERDNTLGELIAISEDGIQIRKLKSASDVTLKWSTDVSDIHRVLTVNEMFGV